ncbi:hypothetical protein ERO13_D07G052933v2 [Gossypium hirsutum]|uniref:RNase H type-1 domain-containing protein n=1 Tax=Gossypium barbadense TaxID=3634 RepID=A0A5J5QQ71_GOSBA|nr:hypothetical protein ES319_D07G055500v1 [Gossypium barbadense]KAG4137135.1 hypothetical protein ERO13_D07G052933v2 [Gossypium hirsutum]
MDVSSLAIVRYVRRLLRRDWKIQIVNVYREGNCVTDTLTNYVCNLSIGHHRLMQPPNEALQVIHDDVSNIDVRRQVPM